MRDFTGVGRIVIKVGTSTLTFGNGELNLKRVEEIARVVTDIKNSGRSVILVTSGAIGVGVARLGVGGRPSAVKDKQAAAAVGQCRLMSIYGEFFGKYNQAVGQVLLTKDVLANAKMRENAVNTFESLFSYGVVPVVNENDTVSTDEILFGDNDTLSAYVATLAGADLLIMLTDVDGLYDGDGRVVTEVREISEDVKNMAGGAGSALGTGGMITKIMAAEIAAGSGIRTLIINGADPALIYKVLDGDQIGTYFNC